MPPRKRSLLRIPQELYDVYEAWAADDFRSVNARLEVTLADAADAADTAGAGGKARRADVGLQPGGGRSQARQAACQG